MQKKANSAAHGWVRESFMQNCWKTLMIWWHIFLNRTLSLAHAKMCEKQLHARTIIQHFELCGLIRQWRLSCHRGVPYSFALKFESHSFERTTTLSEILASRWQVISLSAVVRSKRFFWNFSVSRRIYREYLTISSTDFCCASFLRKGVKMCSPGWNSWVLNAVDQPVVRSQKNAINKP